MTACTYCGHDEAVHDCGSTDFPTGKLPAGPEAIGDQTDRWLCEMRAKSELCVVAWGAHDMARTVRTRDVLALLGDVHALGLTKAGQPRHPLYLRADARPLPYTTTTEAAA